MRCAIPPYRGPAQRAAGLPPKASAGRADDGAIVLGVVEIAAIIAIFGLAMTIRLKICMSDMDEPNATLRARREANRTGPEP